MGSANSVLRRTTFPSNGCTDVLFALLGWYSCMSLAISASIVVDGNLKFNLWLVSIVSFGLLSFIIFTRMLGGLSNWYESTIAQCDWISSPRHLWFESACFVIEFCIGFPLYTVLSTRGIAALVASTSATMTVFCLCRILKPTTDLSLQGIFLGYTLSLLYGSVHIRDSYWVICLVAVLAIGIFLPHLQEAEGKRRDAARSPAARKAVRMAAKRARRAARLAARMAEARSEAANL